MSDRDPCKGCSATVHSHDKQISRIIRALSAHPEQCVDDATYAKRLDICNGCAALAYDSTCMHCGCFVAVRAKLIDKACPKPGQALW